MEEAKDLAEKLDCVTFDTLFYLEKTEKPYTPDKPQKQDIEHKNHDATDKDTRKQFRASKEENLLIEVVQTVPPEDNIEFGEGAYLVFARDVKNGSLLCHWSKEKTFYDSILAYIKPNPAKPIPKYKFKTNNGIYPLMENLNTDSSSGILTPERSKLYLEGWHKFLKTSSEFSASFAIFQTRQHNALFGVQLSLFKESKPLKGFAADAVSGHLYDTQEFVGGGLLLSSMDPISSREYDNHVFIKFVVTRGGRIVPFSEDFSI